MPKEGFELRRREHLMREGRWGGSSGTEGRELQMTAWWRAGAGIQKAFFSLGNGKD